MGGADNILFEPYGKTTINILDDDGMYFHEVLIQTLININMYLLAKYRRFNLGLRYGDRFLLLWGVLTAPTYKRTTLIRKSSFQGLTLNAVVSISSL